MRSLATHYKAKSKEIYGSSLLDHMFEGIFRIHIHAVRINRNKTIPLFLNFLAVLRVTLFEPKT
jgi:hypothetical protein